MANHTGRRRVLVTSAPPNPNGDLHLGHLAGPFLGADVFRRYKRSRGHDVLYASYTDDFNSYAHRKAEELRWTHVESVRHFSQLMGATLAWSDMLPDHYMHPITSLTHRRTVQDFFLRLYERGVIVEAEFADLFCEQCHRFIHEAEGRGYCPHCQAPSDPQYCEDCGVPQGDATLLRPYCNRCKQTPTVRHARRLAFALDRFRDELRGYYASRHWRRPVLDLCTRLLEARLPLIPISRRYQYGCPVPLDAWPGHVLDTWFAAIPSYVSASKDWSAASGRPERWRDFWCDSSTQVVQFLGLDCAFAHAMLYPALLFAGGEYALPDVIVTNSWYQLDGEKFSTSRNHAVWAADFAGQVPPDAIRYYLCLTAPETRPTNFTMAHFQEIVNTDLAGALEDWLGTLATVLRDDFSGTIPDAAPDPSDEVALKLLAEIPPVVERSLEAETFSAQHAARALRDFLHTSRGFLRDRLVHRGSRGGAARYGSAVALSTRLASAFGVLVEPLMPATAAAIGRSFGIEQALDSDDRWVALSRPPGEGAAPRPGWAQIFTPVATGPTPTRHAASQTS